MEEFPGGVNKAIDFGVDDTAGGLQNWLMIKLLDNA